MASEVVQGCVRRNGGRGGFITYGLGQTIAGVVARNIPLGEGGGCGKLNAFFKRENSRSLSPHSGGGFCLLS